MKRLYLVVILIGFFSFYYKLQSQTIKIDTSQITYEQKLRPCLTSKIDQTAKDLENHWVKYIINNYSIKLKGGGFFSSTNFLKAEDVTSAIISNKRFNFYTRIIETPSGSEITVFASYGYDIYISPTSYPKEFKIIQSQLMKFLLIELNQFYTDKSNTISKNIRSLNKSKLSELKTIKKNTSKLTKLKKEIVMLKATIEISEADNLALTEKLGKLRISKTKLENANRESKLIVQNINLKTDDLEKIQDEIAEKHEGLVQ